MKTVVCLHCKSHGMPAKKKRGSNGLALAAWAVFPLGLPFTIWRSMTKRDACKYCESTDVVDADSAMGKRIMDSLVTDIAGPSAAASMSMPTHATMPLETNPDDIFDAPVVNRPPAIAPLPEDFIGPPLPSSNMTGRVPHRPPTPPAPPQEPVAPPAPTEPIAQQAAEPPTPAPEPIQPTEPIIAPVPQEQAPMPPAPTPEPIPPAEPPAEPQAVEVSEQEEKPKKIERDYQSLQNPEEW